MIANASKGTFVRLQRLHEQLFQLTPDFVCITKLDGTLEETNRAWKRNLALTPPEWIGKSLSSFIVDDDRNIFKSWWAQLTQSYASCTEHSEVCEVRLVLSERGERLILWSANVLRDEGLVYAYGRDVTESHASEALLRESEARFRAMADWAPS